MLGRPLSIGWQARVIQGWRVTDSALAIKLDAEQRTGHNRP
jgi:hypothetical protein